MMIEGEKIYLRETRESDWDIFAYWEKLPEVTRFFTINEGRDLMEIADEIRGRADDPTQIDFTICNKRDDSPIGRIYISRIDPHYDSLDITRIYIGVDELRGKGYSEQLLGEMIYWLRYEDVERLYFPEKPDAEKDKNGAE